MSERRRRGDSRTYEESNALQVHDAYAQRDDYDRRDRYDEYDRRERRDDYDRPPPQPRSRSYDDGYNQRDYQPYHHNAPPPVNVYVNNASTNTNTNIVGAGTSAYGESRFDGKLSQIIAWNILGYIITTVTFGICYPWALTMKYGWKIKHTVINGRRLRFTGSAVGLFGQWIKWLLLSVLTFGIYTFWLSIKLEQWKVKHTTFVN